MIDVKANKNNPNEHKRITARLVRPNKTAIFP